MATLAANLAGFTLYGRAIFALVCGSPRSVSLPYASRPCCPVYFAADGLPVAQVALSVCQGCAAATQPTGCKFAGRGGGGGYHPATGAAQGWVFHLVGVWRWLSHAAEGAGVLPARQGW